MKTWRLFLSLLVIVFAVFVNTLSAQTFHRQLTISTNGAMAWCLNRVLAGELTYNFSYHLDNKTGKIDNVHWNVLHAVYWDVETGQKYIPFDTGNDRLGLYWQFFNTPNASNGIPDFYDVEDGWLDSFLPTELPGEGSMISMNFKFISKGGIKFTMSTMIQLHVNANGELTAEVYNEKVECNE